MSKHTKGPWKATGTKALGLSEVISPDCSFQEGHLVCSIQKGGYIDGSKFVEIPKEQREATANLIAAAPELLAACQMLKQWFDYGGDAPEMLTDCVDAAVIAIRKSEGEHED